MRKNISALWILVLVLAAIPNAYSSTETTLHNFTSGTDGANPLADLLYDPVSGFVYGTTNKGGGSVACTGGCGTVFKLHTDGTGYAVVYSFAGGTDGANPQAGLAIDGSGNLYGTTFNGGVNGLGTAFKLTPIGGGLFSESVLHSFGSGTGGTHPQSRLVLDVSGNLFGTTFDGGANGKGVVFRLTPAGTESVLFTFNGANGSKPRAGVVFDASGRLWGTTSVGGAAGLGVVFRLTKSAGTWSETFLYSFTGVDGANPFAEVTLDAAGNVFGTTKFGGSPACGFAAAGCGTVFQFQPSGRDFVQSTIYSFTGGLDGAAPIADVTLALDLAGNQYLYGTASKAGTIGGTCPATGCGTAFELCGVGSSCAGMGTWTEFTLFDFKGKSGGRTPSAGMLVFPPVGAAGEEFAFPPPSGHGKCTSGCMTTTSSGGTSSDGTTDQVSN